VKQNILASLIPRLRDIFFIAILVGAWALGPRMLALDSDLGRHLALGKYILDSRVIPTRDLLSYTRAGDTRPAYEWLSQIILESANRLAGLDGVILVTALVIAAAFTFVYTDARQRSGMPLTALGVTILATLASSLHWLPRPHVMTFLLLSIWLAWLERVRRRETIPLWCFPMLMLVWVNVHGGFLFGALAWLAYLGGWIWEDLHQSANKQVGRRFMLLGGFSLIATLITPSGWGNWQAVLNNSSRYILSRTVETMPPDFSQLGTWPFALLIDITVIVIIVTRKTQSASHIFLLAGFAALGLLMTRNIPLFGITATPILSEGMSNILKRAKRWQSIEANITTLESSLRGAVWPVMFGLVFALFIGIRYQVQKEALNHFNERVFPVAAADWLETHPQPGDMFNEFNWGGYLLYRLWPEQKVFLDSQTDFYGEKLVKEYERILTAQGDWQALLDTYSVKWVILPHTAPLLPALQNENWQTLYSDQIATILKRP
jgi:hypothetical protein